jgi:hypothetical protein
MLKIRHIGNCIDFGKTLPYQGCSGKFVLHIGEVNELIDALTKVKKMYGNEAFVNAEWVDIEPEKAPQTQEDPAIALANRIKAVADLLSGYSLQAISEAIRLIERVDNG